jgi:MYXO-CTERM domain-containing protein
LKVCLPAPPDNGAGPGGETTTTTGCSAAGADFDGAWLLGGVGVAALFASRRRRKVT